jgi:hypothetical protein
MTVLANRPFSRYQRDLRRAYAHKCSIGFRNQRFAFGDESFYGIDVCDLGQNAKFSDINGAQRQDLGNLLACDPLGGNIRLGTTDEPASRRHWAATHNLTQTISFIFIISNF